MQDLFEYSDKLNSPYEAFLFDTEKDNFPVRSHWHYFVEIIYILEGSVIVSSINDSRTASQGTLAIFHPQTVHSIYPDNDRYCKYAVLKFDVNRLNISNSYSPKLSYILAAAKDDASADFLFSGSDLCCIPTEEIFMSCIREIEEKNYGYDLIIQSNLSTLLVELIRIWRQKDFDTNHISVSQVEAESIHTITEYIDSHFSEPLKVQLLADKCGMSYSYFARLFKQLYGQSCKEYIEFMRICKAEDMLLFTNLDLSYISQETGFSDCSHLIKTFKKLKGITPKQFRMKMRK